VWRRYRRTGWVFHPVLLSSGGIVIKCKEIADPKSCLNRAWIDERLRSGKNEAVDAQIVEAEETLRNWR
jgi:hypothetical protein